LVVLPLETSTEFERIDSRVDVLEVGRLNRRPEDFSWLSKDFIVFALVKKFDPEDQFVEGRPLNLRGGIRLQFIIKGFF
jgi:hypothetical protein